jgi:hypothetical protein
MLAGLLYGQAGAPAILDQEKAGLDFHIQGEYEGETSSGGKMAAQVVTIADGKFRVLFYPGGLPGAGWDGRPKNKVQAEAARNGQKTIVTGPWQGEIDADARELRGKTDKGTPFTLRRITRKSPTEGASPPAGAIVLFDGSGTEQFPKAQMSESKLLMVPATSKLQFGDIQLHLEFLVPYRCPSRGNSGVYLQNHYEIQILDSFGSVPSESGCGGLYTFRKPDVNMSFPPLSWQTLDVEYTAARFDAEGKVVQAPIITVRHNGTIIHEKVALRVTSKPPPPLGPLFLQRHGSPVFYRNIWVVDKKQG